MARRNSLVGPIIAVLISGGVGAFMFSIVNSEKTEAIPAPKEIIKEAPTVRILVANNDISIGKRLNTNDMSWRAWPESLLNPDYITENQNPNFINDLVGGIAKMPIVSGEPIIEGKIVKADGSRGAMAVLLRKGMRAISIEVSARTGAGGFILPGDFVDVIFTGNLLRDDVFKSNNISSKVPPIANYLFMRSLSKQRKDVNETSVSSKENDEKINTKNSSEPNSNQDIATNTIEQNDSKDAKQVKIDEKTSERLFNLTQDEDKLLKKIEQEDELFVADSNNLSEGLLENVKVLAIDQNIDYSKKDQNAQNQNAAIVGTTATLEVTPEQAKLLAWASNIGKLTLSLRSFGETLSAIDNKILNQQVPKITTNFALPLEKVLEASSLKQTTQGLQIIRSGNISSMDNVPTKQNNKIKESQKTSGDTDVKINAHMHKIISFVCFISMASVSNVYADADNGKGIIIKKNNNQKLGSMHKEPKQIQISETTLMQGNTAETKYIDIPVNKAAILKLPRPSRDVVVANPELMDVVVRTPQEIYLFAKKAGHTNAFIFDAAGKQIVNLEINVGLDIKELERVFNEQIRDSNIKVTSMADTIILSGNVKNASHAKIAQDISRRMVDSPEKVINNIGVTGQEQVMIKVKVAEMQRTILKQLGIDWNTAFQFGSFNGGFGLANSFASNGAPATGLVGNAVNTSNIISKSIGGLPSFANATAVTGYLSGLVNDRTRLIGLINGNRDRIFSIVQAAAQQGRGPNGPEQTLISQLQGEISTSNAELGPLNQQILNIQNQLDNGTVIGDDGLETRRRTAGFTAGNLAIDHLLKALERNSLIKTLAEPNLTALSGESAKFLAGGELPYIVASTLGQAQVDFKPYGVGLAFTPVVLDNDRISLKVSTEISEIGDTVTAQNSSYPGLNIRRAETTVEMPSGGTMAMAGLIRDDTRRSIDSTPGLKEVPVLGPLFRSNDFKNLQSELVVLVTPYLAKPAHESEFGLPTDGYANPSDLDMYVRGHLAAVYDDDKNEKDEGSLTDTIGNLFTGEKDADTTTNNNSDEYIVE